MIHLKIINGIHRKFECRNCCKLRLWLHESLMAALGGLSSEAELSKSSPVALHLSSGLKLQIHLKSLIKCSGLLSADSDGFYPSTLLSPNPSWLQPIYS